MEDSGLNILPADTVTKIIDEQASNEVLQYHNNTLNDNLGMFEMVDLFLSGQYDI